MADAAQTHSVTAIAQLDRAIAQLVNRKEAWLQVSIPERLQYLHQCMNAVDTIAERWANAACTAKGIDPATPLAGEEWITGPLATLLNLRMLHQALQASGQPKPVATTARADGQVVAQVFPDSVSDRLLWLGFKVDVWMQPGADATQGLVYRQKPQSGRVALVLGAGNVSAIAAMDTLYKLFAEDQVVLLKLNPVNDYIGEFLQQAFCPLIVDGWLQIVYGGAAVGKFLCQHREIDTIHVTGSGQTHDAIVWGTAERSHRIDPITVKPITSELGSVTPVLVVPGNWSTADLKFQARHVASMVVHNASFNCVAAQVVVTARGWSQREAFLQLLRQELASTPSRKAYYPGATERYRTFLDRYPQALVLGDAVDVPWTSIPDVPAAPGEYALTTEAFCGVLAEVTLEAADASEFLHQAVPFVNETVWGNLSCVLLIDSQTAKRCQRELDEAIAQLEYGAIGINAWTGMTFLLAPPPWGAFPGNPLNDIRSGRGVVHNTHLFEYPQKSILYAPFRIFPTPIWFSGHRNLQRVAHHYTKFLLTPNGGKFLRLILAALQG